MQSKPVDTRDTLLSAIRGFSAAALKPAKPPSAPPLPMLTPADSEAPAVVTSDNVLDTRSALLFSISNFGKQGGKSTLRKVEKKTRASVKEMATSNTPSMQEAINKVLGARRKALNQSVRRGRPSSDQDGSGLSRMIGLDH